MTWWVMTQNSLVIQKEASLYCNEAGSQRDVFEFCMSSFILWPWMMFVISVENGADADVFVL